MKESNIFFSGSINLKNSNRFIYLLNNSRNIINNIYLNTYGGSVDNSIMIIEHIRMYRNNIDITVCGTCQSAGTLILAGATGRRLMTSNSYLMYHRTSFGNCDINNYSMKSINNIMKLNNEIEKQIYFKNGFDKHFFEEFDKSDIDFYLNSSKALKLKIIDGVV